MIKFSEDELKRAIEEIKKNTEHNKVKIMYYSLLANGASPFEAIDHILNVLGYNYEDVLAFVQNDKNVLKSLRDDIKERGLIRDAYSSTSKTNRLL